MNDAVFKALAHPDRRKILEILAKDLRARPTRQIFIHFSCTESAISQHLKVLLNAGLIHVSVHGKSWLYFFDPEPFNATAAALQALAAHANGTLNGPAGRMMTTQRYRAKLKNLANHNV